MSLTYWIGGAAGVIVLALLGKYSVALHESETKIAREKTQSEKAFTSLSKEPTEQERREYVLEVVGLGVTLDKYRQGKLWERLQMGSPHSTIRETDGKEYPWKGTDKEGLTGGRNGDALDNGVWDSPDCWGVPVFNAEPPLLGKIQDSPLSPVPGIVGDASSNGMTSHLFVLGPRRFAERPDRILDDVFEFFDAHPEVPYVILNSDDNSSLRNIFAASPKYGYAEGDGYFVPAMPDSAVVFVLARRERADVLRPFIYDDVDSEERIEKLNAEGVQRRLNLAYFDLMKSVPTKDTSSNFPSEIGRQPLISEWLAEAAKFAERKDIRRTKQISSLKPQVRTAHLPSPDWKPTPWFPVPWSKKQFADFDSLPTMGFIHRPVFVNTSDQDGKPLRRRDQRRAALLAGFNQALSTLSESERASGPARIIASTNNNTEQLIALEGVLHDFAAKGGPEIDSGKTNQFINTDRRLGDTGAATLFMQMAIGVMGSYRAGGVSAAINLRDPSEASIIFISPPSAEKLHAQRNRNVFRHRNSLDIDPANYAPPSKPVPTKE